jgi:hypothetical protein
MRVNILIFIIIFFVPVAALATNIYVDADCTGNPETDYDPAGNSCSGGSDTVYSTVANAVAAMSGGDDIYIRGGTYNEGCIYISGNDSGTAENYSSIQSYPGEWAIIDGERDCDCVAKSVFAMNASPQLQYFKFERLEITGGGLSGGSGVTAAGIYLYDVNNVVVRYCYIHDNLADDGTENPAGVSLHTPMGCVIEYNWFDDNGTVAATNGNATNINFFSDYKDDTDDDFDSTNCTKENIVRYNLLQSPNGYAVSGLRHKNQQIFGEQDRDPNDMTYKNWGDKWHHNIIMDMDGMGIEVQQDFAQVYNNIIHFKSGVREDNNGGIFIKKFGSAAEVYQTTVYNNTILGSGAEITGIHVSGLSSSKDFHPYSQVYNNIVSNFGDDYRREDISLGTTINSANDWDPLGTITLTDCPVDRNYVYQPADADEYAVARADYFGGDHRFTTAEYNSAYSVTNYTNAYNAEDLLFQDTSGAGQYKTRSAHVLTGATTIANGGIGGAHPYLSGVTIPSYVGATDPHDNAWVAGVLSLATYTNLRDSDPDSDPIWIEGNTGVTITNEITIYNTTTILIE